MTLASTLIVLITTLKRNKQNKISRFLDTVQCRVIRLQNSFLITHNYTVCQIDFLSHLKLQSSRGDRNFCTFGKTALCSISCVTGKAELAETHKFCLAQKTTERPQFNF